MSGAPPWPEDRTSRLGELIDNGASASQAARAMGIGRGAVTGRVFRLGWRIGVPRTEAQRTPPFLCIRWGLDQPVTPRPPRVRRDPADAPVRVACNFDRETYDIILARANAEGVTRLQIVRELVEWGLEAVQQGAAE